MNSIQIVGKQFDNMPAKKLKNLLNDDLQSKEYQVAVLTMVHTYGAACAAVSKTALKLLSPLIFIFPSEWTAKQSKAAYGFPLCWLTHYSTDRSICCRERRVLILHSSKSCLSAASLNSFRNGSKRPFFMQHGKYMRISHHIWTRRQPRRGFLLGLDGKLSQA